MKEEYNLSTLIKSIEAKEKALVDSEVLITADGLSAWSHSKVQLLYKCPLQFYLKYILKVKPVDVTVSVITEIGKAAHRVLELAPSGNSVDTILARVRKEFPQLSEDEWKNVEELEFNIMKFQAKLKDFEAIHGVKRYIHELRIGVTKNFQPTGFFSDDVWFRGVIDFVIQMNNSDAIMIDHKTGAPAVMGVKNFQKQLDTYKVLFHHGVEKINGAKSGIHFIKDGEVKMDEYSDAEEIETTLRDKVTSSINVAIDMVHDLGIFKKTPGQTVCKYCDYVKECKSGLLKEAEQGTVRFFK